MIDSQALWVSSIVLFHVLGLACLFFSLISLSHGPSWLLSWTRGDKHTDLSNWNVVDVEEDEDLSSDETMPPCHVLSFQNLGCSYLNHDSNIDSKVLISCSGSVASGGMLALLGPSGSGKSTLLDILAGRKTTGILSGEVKWNGQTFNRNLVSYVPQHMDFPPSLTLTEALLLVACLVLPLASLSEKEHRMNEVLKSLGLGSARDTLIGGWLPGGVSIRGLSGGETKRLSISTGLLNTPQVLILDEPTTGQDSQHASQCMRSLKSLAVRKGMIVISSIHQPSKQIFDLFTDVVLLSHGRMIFSGKRELCLPWLTSEPPHGLHLGPYCPVKHGNACDWFLDIVNMSFPRPKKLYGRALESNSDLDRAAMTFVEQLAGAAMGSASQNSNPPAASNGLSWITSCFVWANQVRVMAWREFTLTTRNPADIAGRLLINCWVGLFLGVVFWGSGGRRVDDIRSTSSALFIEVIASQLLPFIYMSLSQSDKMFFVSDARAGRISPSAYLAAKALTSLPFSLVNIAALVVLAYGMIGLNTEGSALALHYVVAALGFLVACQVIILASLLAANQDQAFGFAIGFTSLSLLLSDTIIRYSDMSWTWIRCLRYLSPMWWTTRGVLRVQFQDQDYSCVGGLANNWVTREIIPLFLPLDSNVHSPFVQNLILSPGKTCIVYGQDLLAYFDAEIPLATVILSLLGYLLGLYLLTFLALHLVKARGERR